MMMKNIIFIFLAAFFCVSCSWESELFDRYADENGYITLCPGVCQSTQKWDQQQCLGYRGSYSNKICTVDKIECNNYKWLPYTTVDLGNGNYGRHIDNKYICGTFNDVMKAEASACSKEDAERIAEDITRGFCEYNSQCLEFHYAGITMNEAMCSSCNLGEAKCLRDDGSATCVDLNNDNDNCGACAHVCPQNKECRNGYCGNIQ